MSAARALRRAAVSRGRGFRVWAPLFALIAMLLQQSPVPLFSLALGGADCGMPGMSMATPPHHDQGSGDPGDTDLGHNGPCHFCRLVGAVVPPPPMVEIARLEPASTVYVASDQEPPPPEWKNAAHRVRGPPSSSTPA
jgi:hypothetical protein